MVFVQAIQLFQTYPKLFSWLHSSIPSIGPWFDCRRKLALATSRSPAFGG